MRIERVVLEHHRHVAVFRRHVVDHLAVDPDLAAGDVLEAGDHPQRRRFAAAGRADQNHELLVRDIEIDAAYRDCVVEVFDHVAERDVRHGASALCGASGEACDVVVHQEGIDDQRRRGAEQRAGHNLSPVEHVALDQRGDDADRQH